MDNADKINKSQIHREVELFLGDELKKKKSQPPVSYNLEEEYAKTKKNRKLFVWVLLGLCFFLVGTGTLTTFAVLLNSNEKIKINIDTFDDLNLRSLLNNVGRVQLMYESAVRNKAALEQNYAEEISFLEQKRKADLHLIESVQAVSSREYVRKQKAAAEKEYADNLAVLKKEYEEKLIKAEEEIKKYQEQIKKYDAEEVDKAKNAEASLDSTKQLHDMQMKSQIDAYESKILELRQRLAQQQKEAAEEQKNAVEQVRKIYQAKIDLLDPAAREESAEQDKIITAAGITSNASRSSTWADFNKLTLSKDNYGLKNSKSEFADSVDAALSEFNSLKTIAGRFEPMPMEKSIKDYVPAMVNQTYQIADSLSKSGASAARQLDTLYEFAEKELDSSSMDGLLTDSFDSTQMTAYIREDSRKLIPESSAFTVGIYQGSKEYAKGKLTFANNSYKVSLLSDSEGGTYSGKVTPGSRIKIIEE
ncbi:hypothetical protein [Treponema sp.]|uniref:hypothetical protein n=1 Tax=Treponema sp. TaxID=166 RepID=UPI0025F801FF|nr:hypothetical protein [Treponema sp.]MCR5219079.1 hypothetical protein [Treponema sp.]